MPRTNKWLLVHHGVSLLLVWKMQIISVECVVEPALYNRKPKLWYWLNVATLANNLSSSITSTSVDSNEKGRHDSTVKFDPCPLFPFPPFLPVSGCGCSLQRGFGACVWDVVRELRLPPACYQGSVAMHNWEGKFAMKQSRKQTAPSLLLISGVLKTETSAMSLLFIWDDQVVEMVAWSYPPVSLS